MVAPSFVTVISPSGEIKILSSPRGPYVVFSLELRMLFQPHPRTRDVRTIFATVLAANMCDFTASFPCCRFFFP